MFASRLTAATALLAFGLQLPLAAAQDTDTATGTATDNRPPAPIYAVPAPGSPYGYGPPMGEIVAVVKSYEQRPSYGMIITGAVVFGGLYMVTTVPLLLATNDGKMAIPVVGPFIEAGQLGGHSGDLGLKFLLAFDGLAQGAMLGMFIAGLAIKRKTPVYEKMMLLPSVSSGAVGMAAVGRF